jgi:hypothetical protein
MIERSNVELASRRGNDSSFPNVQYPTECFQNCYGSGSSRHRFSTLCSMCINNFTKVSDGAVAVVGAGVHILNYWTKKLDPSQKAQSAVQGDAAAEAINRTVDDIKRFLDLAHQTIYVSMPNYQTEKVPLPYKNATHNSASGWIYKALLPYVAPLDMSHPFVDVFQLTGACHMDNCSYDGGHR